MPKKSQTLYAQQIRGRQGQWWGEYPVVINIQRFHGENQYSEHHLLKKKENICTVYGMVKSAHLF